MNTEKLYIVCSYILIITLLVVTNIQTVKINDLQGKIKTLIDVQDFSNDKLEEIDYKLDCVGFNYNFLVSNEGDENVAAN